MKKLFFVLVLLYTGVEATAQSSLVPRQIEVRMGYGLSQLVPHGLYFETMLTWDKPLSWLSGFRYAMDTDAFFSTSQSPENAYVASWAWYSGLDYALLDEYSNQNMHLNGSVGMVSYMKNFSAENLILETEQAVVISPFVRLGCRYQYQFGVVGLYAQPWVLFGKKREFGGDIGIVIRRSTR